MTKDGQSGCIKLDWTCAAYPETAEAAGISNLFASESSRPEETTAPATDAPETTDAENSVSQSDGVAFGSDVSAPAEDLTEAAAVSGRPLSPAGIIGVCVAAAAVLALTAFVTLRLIRRKKAD